jgi:signal transduction histidine kinase
MTTTVEALERIAKDQHASRVFVVGIALRALSRARAEAAVIEAAKAWRVRVAEGLHPSPLRMFTALDALSALDSEEGK